MTGADESLACDIAHGRADVPATGRTVAAVFDTPVARFLLGYAADAGYQTVLVEPDPARGATARAAGLPVAASVAVLMATVGDDAETTDVVVTDHHRDELGTELRDALGHGAGWVGIMGNPRHQGPHLAALAELGVPPEQIAKVHRPIGLNIGSRAPAEIAISTLAGLIADRNGKPGGFAF